MENKTGKMIWDANTTPSNALSMAKDFANDHLTYYDTWINVLDSVFLDTLANNDQSCYLRIITACVVIGVDCPENITKALEANKGLSFTESRQQALLHHINNLLDLNIYGAEQRLLPNVFQMRFKDINIFVETVCVSNHYEKVMGILEKRNSQSLEYLNAFGRALRSFRLVPDDDGTRLLTLLEADVKSPMLNYYPWIGQENRDLRFEKRGDPLKNMLLTIDFEQSTTLPNGETLRELAVKPITLSSEAELGSQLVNDGTVLGYKDFRRLRLNEVAMVREAINCPELNEENITVCMAFFLDHVVFSSDLSDPISGLNSLIDQFKKLQPRELKDILSILIQKAKVGQYFYSSNMLANQLESMLIYRKPDQSYPVEMLDASISPGSERVKMLLSNNFGDLKQTTESIPTEWISDCEEIAQSSLDYRYKVIMMNIWVRSPIMAYPNIQHIQNALSTFVQLLSQNAPESLIKCFEEEYKQVGLVLDLVNRGRAHIPHLFLRMFMKLNPFLENNTLSSYWWNTVVGLADSWKNTPELFEELYPSDIVPGEIDVIQKSLTNKTDQRLVCSIIMILTQLQTLNGSSGKKISQNITNQLRSIKKSLIHWAVDNVEQLAIAYCEQTNMPTVSELSILLSTGGEIKSVEQLISSWQLLRSANLPAPVVEGAPFAQIKPVSVDTPASSDQLRTDVIPQPFENSNTSIHTATPATPPHANCYSFILQVFDDIFAAGKYLLVLLLSIPQKLYNFGQSMRFFQDSTVSVSSQNSESGLNNPFGVV